MFAPRVRLRLCLRADPAAAVAGSPLGVNEKKGEPTTPKRGSFLWQHASGRTCLLRKIVRSFCSLSHCRCYHAPQQHLLLLLIHQQPYLHTTVGGAGLLAGVPPQPPTQPGSSRLIRVAICSRLLSPLDLAACCCFVYLEAASRVEPTAEPTSANAAGEQPPICRVNDGRVAAGAHPGAPTRARVSGGVNVPTSQQEAPYCCCGRQQEQKEQPQHFRGCSCATEFRAVRGASTLLERRRQAHSITRTSLRYCVSAAAVCSLLAVGRLGAHPY